MDKLALVIKTKAQVGKRDELLDLYMEMMAPRAEENDAQEVVVWSTDQHDPDAFFLFEIYRDGEAFNANAAAPWFADYMAKAGPLLAGEPEVSMATPRWSKGSRAAHTRRRLPQIAISAASCAEWHGHDP